MKLNFHTVKLFISILKGGGGSKREKTGDAEKHNIVRPRTIVFYKLNIEAEMLKNRVVKVSRVRS